jgi:hypothetical protein
MRYQWELILVGTPASVTLLGWLGWCRVLTRCQARPRATTRLGRAGLHRSGGQRTLDNDNTSSMKCQTELIRLDDQIFLIFVHL